MGIFNSYSVLGIIYISYNVFITLYSFSYPMRIIKYNEVGTMSSPTAKTTKVRFWKKKVLVSEQSD